MNTNKISLEINSTLDELLKVLSSVKQEQINIIPFEGSWTAGQLAEHLVLSGSGFVQILNGPVKESDRAPDKQVEKIKSDFLNFNIKMSSPAFVVPPAKVYIKEDLLRSLNEIKDSINQAIEKTDLSKTCLAFELPGIGFLTRLEAASFILYHTQRHIHQLKNICQKLPGYSSQ